MLTSVLYWQIKVTDHNWKIQSLLITIMIHPTKFYVNWAIRAEVMGGRTFLSPLNPSAKTPALIESIKRKTLLFTLHIALESIPQLKCLAFQLMINHDVYLDNDAWRFHFISPPRYLCWCWPSSDLFNKIKPTAKEGKIA